MRHFNLRVKAHALREEKADLNSFAIGGTQRHPRGTNSKLKSRRRVPVSEPGRGHPRFTSLLASTGGTTPRASTTSLQR